MKFSISIFLVLCIYLTACNTKETPDLKDASYFIDSTKRNQRAKNIDPAQDSVSGQFKKPTSASDRTETKVKPQVKRSPKYYLIVGSFKDFNNAKKFSSNLAQSGQTAEVLDKQDNLNRIAFKMFTNKKQAISELIKYKQDHKDSTAWILFK
jgi:cell division protein FtsN